MKTKKNANGVEPLGFKNIFGTTIMGAAEGFSAALMTGWFMLYLTDYAGLGKWAAALGSTILLAVRAFDAVNDPLQGWIIDNAKVGKLGKYKPFIILSIFMIVIGVSCLFFIPSSLLSSPVAATIWIIVFYLMYDIGSSFYAPNLIYRTLTLDSVQRGKLVIGPRLFGMLMGMVSSALILMVNQVNSALNDMRLSFGVTVTGILIITGLISLLGISMVKEKYHAPQSEKSERVKITDIFRLIRDNKALRIKLISQLFDGFIWAFLFATAVYYIKWAYCADLATGVVDNDKYGFYSAIASIMMLLPLIVGTIIATPLMKKIGSPIKFYRLLILVQSISCGLLFVLQILGILQQAPMIFFSCMAIAATAIGCSFIPGTALIIECMDYEVYKNGKDRSALCNACDKFLIKAQNAVSASVVGVLLVSVGYIVDSTTGNYIGDLAAIPQMLTWFIVIMGLIPFVLGMVSWIILREYPITNETREKMKNALAQKESYIGM
ncbi:MAG: hypothetical protein GX892_04340 [Thermoanaerobacteraceae bacterium]|nr:hypothetical protein [Thermoanaerobacteraceae bacterium]